jgi:hypothetical protein
MVEERVVNGIWRGLRLGMYVRHADMTFPLAKWEGMPAGHRYKPGS